MRLYLFEHCSICFRVRMAAALKRMHLQETVVLEPTRVYRVADARVFLTAKGIDAIAELVDGKFMSAFIRATKPQTAERACCN